MKKRPPGIRRPLSLYYGEAARPGKPGRQHPVQVQEQQVQLRLELQPQEQLELLLQEQLERPQEQLLLALLEELELLPHRQELQLQPQEQELLVVRLEQEQHMDVPPSLNSVGTLPSELSYVGWAAVVPTLQKIYFTNKNQRGIMQPS